MIRTVVTLDYETVSQFDFHVRVSDLGKPRLTSETIAHVHVSVTDVNDCPPIFSQSEYNTTVIVPTYNNIAVVQVSHLAVNLNNYWYLPRIMDLFKKQINFHQVKMQLWGYLFRLIRKGDNRINYDFSIITLKI